DPPAAQVEGTTTARQAGGAARLRVVAFHWRQALEEAIERRGKPAFERFLQFRQRRAERGPAIKVRGPLEVPGIAVVGLPRLPGWCDTRETGRCHARGAAGARAPFRPSLPR